MVRKKWWTGLAALLTTLSLFACVGCGKTNQTSGGEQSEPSTQNSSSGSETEDETPKETHWEDDGVLKILTIGNSFSCDTMQWIYQIARDAGVENLFLGNLDSSGFSLSNHLTHAQGNMAKHIYHTNSSGTWSVQQNYLLNDAVTSQNWDFISFQQASGSSGQPHTYDVLQKLMDYVRPLCPNAKFVWNMTWAYQADSTHSAFVNYKNDQEKMYTAIVRTVQAKVLPNEGISVIAPTGTAIQNARTSCLGDTLTRDGFHLTYDIGRYTAGLTFFHSLTGIDISGISYAPDGVTAEAKQVAIESAINAVKTPYEVTPSQYK